MHSRRGRPPAINNRGQMLVGALVAATVSAFFMMSFLSMFKSESSATRKIAASEGVVDLSHALDALFGGNQCASTGIFLNHSKAATVSLLGSSYSLTLDTIEFASGSVAISSSTNPSIASMIEPYSIKPLSFVALGGKGVISGGFTYPFKLTVDFGSPSGPPPVPLNKFLTVYTDPSNKVVGACYTSEPLGVDWTHPDVTLWIGGGGGGWSRSLKKSAATFAFCTVFVTSVSGVYQACAVYAPGVGYELSGDPKNWLLYFSGGNGPSGCGFYCFKKQ